MYENFAFVFSGAKWNRICIGVGPADSVRDLQEQVKVSKINGGDGGRWIGASGGDGNERW